MMLLKDLGMGCSGQRLALAPSDCSGTAGVSQQQTTTYPVRRQIASYKARVSSVGLAVRLW